MYENEFVVPINMNFYLRQNMSLPLHLSFLLMILFALQFLFWFCNFCFSVQFFLWFLVQRYTFGWLCHHVDFSSIVEKISLNFLNTYFKADFMYFIELVYQPFLSSVWFLISSEYSTSLFRNLYQLVQNC